MEELDDLSSIAGLALSPHTPLHKPAQSPSVGTGDSGAREGGEGAGEPRDIYFGLRIDEALALDSEMEEVGMIHGHASFPVASLLDCARVDWSGVDVGNRFLLLPRAARRLGSVCCRRLSLPLTHHGVVDCPRTPHSSIFLQFPSARVIMLAIVWHACLSPTPVCPGPVPR